MDLERTLCPCIDNVVLTSIVSEIGVVDMATDIHNFVLRRTT